MSNKLPKKAAVDVPGAKTAQLVGIPGDITVEEKVRILTVANSEGLAEAGWGSEMLKEDVTFVSATATPTGRTVFKFTVKPKHCNRLNNLHGGCTATLFDWLTTSALAPIAKPGYWQYVGVSRTLNVTYIKPVPVGSTVTLECTVVHAGRRLATITGTMKNEKGDVVAVCEHGKVSIDPEVPKL